MIKIEKINTLALTDLKQNGLLPQKCREVKAQPDLMYDVTYRQGEAALAVLMASSKFEAAVSDLDPEVSKPVNLSRIQLNPVAVGLRAEEIYRMVTGLLEFPGAEAIEYVERLVYSGFERKLFDNAAQRVIISEILLAADGAVETTYPISQTSTVSALTAGGEAQVGGSGGIAATLIYEGIEYTSQVQNESGDNVQVQYLPMTPAVAATLPLGTLSFAAIDPGAEGNDITVEFVTEDGIQLGEESATVTDSAIVVKILPGQTTAALIANVLNNLSDFTDIATVQVLIPAAHPSLMPATPLAGGADAIGVAGEEVVTVSGTLIQVQLESGVSTVAQVRTALDGNPDVAVQVTHAIADGAAASNTVTATGEARNLSGGMDSMDALKLGVLELSVGGNPVEDGAQVEVSYETSRFVVYELVHAGEVQAVITSKALIGYLTA